MINLLSETYDLIKNNRFGNKKKGVKSQNIKVFPLF